MKVGRMAGTDYNRVAARAFRRCRDESGMNQADFATGLSDAMGLRARARFKQSTLSGWEIGTRQVPAAALIAATEVARISMTAALGLGQADDLAVRLEKVERALGARGASPLSKAIAGDVRRSVKRRN